jgi:hypothetical protein
MKHNVKAKIITDQSITILTDMEPLTIRQGQPNFANVAKLIHEGNMDEAIDILLTPIADHIARVSEGNITVENGEVMFRGNEIHHVVADKILKMLENDSKDYLPLVRFVDKLFQNPSQRAREELYDFLSYRALPITESGNVLGYKGVREDHFSCSGNLSTRVISGHVDGQGRIRNQVGDYLEVERSDVDDNRERGCSSGLHVGSFDYAKGFGRLTKLVEFNPKDAVSVPSDCEYQKLRVCAYTVLEEYENEKDIDDAVYGMESHGGGSQVDEMLREEAETFIWLKVKRGDIVTVRDIQNHLDRAVTLECREQGEEYEGMSSNEIVDLVYELGFRLRLNHESISDSVVTS